MGLRDFFGQKEEQPVVFSGSVREADLVLVLLKSAGFHPYEQAEFSMSTQGPWVRGRVLVPPEELEEARAFLDEVRENACEDSKDWK